MKQPSAPAAQQPAQEVPISPGDEAPQGRRGTGETICRSCGGSGRDCDRRPCATCSGTGKVTVGIGGA